jgi:GxxExxY protein
VRLRRATRPQNLPLLSCFDAVVVDVKAGPAIDPADCAQVLNYLASTRYQCGVLFNFGAPGLEYRRVVRSSDGRA